MIDTVRWFAAAWRDRGRRQAVLAEYQQLGRLKYALADIALRGAVFGEAGRTPGDVFGDGINEGRRQMAVEIIKLAGEDPTQIWALVERREPRRQEDDR